MQKNPEKVYAGNRIDSVGPGHYDSKPLQEIYQAKGTSWGKSRGKRGLEARSTTAPTLGPGSYFEGKLSNTPMYKAKPSAVFQSKTKRQSYIPHSGDISSFKELPEEDSDSSGEEGNPGPGHYYNEQIQSGFVTKGMPKVQCFGSSTDRFKTAIRTDNQLGPGHYGDLRKPIAERKTGYSKAPFSSTNARFESKAESNPGPGSYKDSNIQENLQKKVWGRHGVFGSTERRFVGQRNTEAPGPGHYPPDAHKRIGVHNSSKRKATSVFASRSKREIAGVTSNPAPGSYDLPSEFGKQKTQAAPNNPILLHLGDNQKKQVGFSTQQDRFKASFIPKGNHELGPGYYEVTDSRPPRNNSLSKNSLGKADRFKYSQKEATPGPGAYYDEELQQNWNKRSYNIIFSELE